MRVGNTTGYKYLKASTKSDFLVFAKKLVKYQAVGTCIEVTEHEDVVKSPYTPIGLQVDEKTAAAWIADDRALAAELGMSRVIKKNLNRYYDTAVGQLATVYKGMNYKPDEAFFIKLINDIKIKAMKL